MDSRTIANSRILTRKQSNQRLVLAQGDARKTPNAAIGRAGYAKARAGDRGVMRPRIVLEGVEQPGQFGKQSLVRVLKLAAPMKRLGQELAFARRDRCVREPRQRQPRTRRGSPRSNSAPPGCRRRWSGSRRPSRLLPQAKPRRDPSPRDERCQRARSPEAIEASTTRMSSDQHSPRLSSEARTLIGAIVGEYDNADQRWRNRPP